MSVIIIESNKITIHPIGPIELQLKGKINKDNTLPMRAIIKYK